MAQRILDADAGGQYASPGYLLFVHQGSLFAQKFDTSQFKLSGNPVPVADQVAVDLNLFGSSVSVSPAGPIAYRKTAGPQQLLWFDRSGKEADVVGPPDAASPMNPAMSPDGRTVALTRTVNGNTDIWLLETMRGLLRRLTVDSGIDTHPIWGSSGDVVLFTSNRNGAYELYRKSATGPEPEELLYETLNNTIPLDVSRDGRFMIFIQTGGKTGYDLWALPLQGDRKAFPVVETQFEERDAQFSPDGKWIAYRSNESGRFEIYVQPFPGPGNKTQVSTNGGAQPRWKADGKELFYIDLGSRMIAVPIQTRANGSALEPGAPTALFTTSIALGPFPGTGSQQYAVSGDGQRFLINSQNAASSPISLILNWHPQ